VDRAGFPNDTLFFWAWESQNGSLTASAGERSGEPWGIWLNGGYVLDLFNEGFVLRKHRPGSSSLVGLLQEVRHCFLIYTRIILVDFQLTSVSERAYPCRTGLLALLQQLQLEQGCRLRLARPARVRRFLFWFMISSSSHIVVEPDFRRHRQADIVRPVTTSGYTMLTMRTVVDEDQMGLDFVSALNRSVI
jgi:hypothetical protein